MRRRVMVLALLAGLAACHSEPDFDEKYRQNSEQAAQAASSMEAELQQRLDVSSAAGNGVTADSAQ